MNVANEKMENYFQKRMFHTNKFENESNLSLSINAVEAGHMNGHKKGAFNDNKKCAEMLTTYPNGIFSLLENECMFPKVAVVVFCCLDTNLCYSSKIVF